MCSACFLTLRQCIFCAPLELKCYKEIMHTYFCVPAIYFAISIFVVERRRRCHRRCLRRYLYCRFFFLSFVAVAVWFNCVKHHGWMITGVVCCQLPLPPIHLKSNQHYCLNIHFAYLSSLVGQISAILVSFTSNKTTPLLQPFSLFKQRCIHRILKEAKSARFLFMTNFIKHYDSNKNKNENIEQHLM